MDTLICSVAPSGHPALPLSLHVKQIHGVVMHEWRSWLSLVEVVSKDGVAHWWQTYCACVRGLDVHAPV